MRLLEVLFFGLLGLGVRSRLERQLGIVDSPCSLDELLACGAEGGQAGTKVLGVVVAPRDGRPLVDADLEAGQTDEGDSCAIAASIAVCLSQVVRPSVP